MPAPTAPRRRIHPAWIVLIGTLVVLVTMAGFRSTVGVLVDPLGEEFGWTTAAISLAAGLNLMIYGFGGPFAAALYDRFGLRRCVLVAVGVVALGSLATLVMRAEWQFALLWGVVNGTATGAVSVTLAAVVANRWFVARRGLATGILTAASATGQLLFICGMTTTGLIGTHLIPAATSHGMTEVAAAGLLATIGVFDLVGTLASGWLTDRYDPRLLLAWYYGLRGLSLLALPVVIEARGPGLIAFVVFYGLDWVATVPPTVALTADAFGRERVGLVFGWIFAAHQLGAGLSETLLGSYTPAFVVAALLGLVAAGLSLRIAAPARPALAAA